jgi:hypothetical protein
LRASCCITRLVDLDRHAYDFGVSVAIPAQARDGQGGELGVRPWLRGVSP